MGKNAFVTTFMGCLGIVAAILIVLFLAFACTVAVG